MKYERNFFVILTSNEGGISFERQKALYINRSWICLYDMPLIPGAFNLKGYLMEKEQP